MQLEIDIKLRAAVKFDSDAEVWVSWCPALDVYSQGTSRSRAELALKEALTMYVRYCFQERILDKVLGERGFKPSKHNVENNPDDVFGEFIKVRVVPDIPIHQHTPSMFDVTVPLPLASAQLAC